MRLHADLVWDSPTLRLKSSVAPGDLRVMQVLRVSAAPLLPTHATPPWGQTNINSFLLTTPAYSYMRVHTRLSLSRFEIGLWYIGRP